MNPPRRCANPAGPRGLTLIEVVAALALLAVVLSAAATARGRLVRARAAAVERRLAVAALDAALHDWWAAGTPAAAGLGPGTTDPVDQGRRGPLTLNPATNPPPAAGARSPWAWWSRVVHEPQLAARGLQRVRIEAQRPDATSSAPPLVVDVLTPLPPEVQP